MSDLKRCLDNAYDAIKHESYNDALSSILEAQEHAKDFEDLANNSEVYCCLGLGHKCPLNVNDGFCAADTCQYQVTPK